MANGTRRRLAQVYDLAPVNAYTEAFGIGVFHSGVEFMGTEYTFGGHERDSSGIFTHSPRQAPNATFRTTINLGETDKSAQDVRAEIAALGEHFPGQSYSLITKNCNHFSVPGPPLDDCLRARAEADVDCKVADAESRVQNELALRLTGQPIPPWVNRLAYLGSWVGCLLPKDLGVAHPDAPAAQGSRSQYGRSSATAFKPFAGQVGARSLAAPPPAPQPTRRSGPGPD